MLITLKKPREIEKIRKAGCIVARTFAELKAGTLVRADTKTETIDEFIETFITDQGAIPAFKGYRGFPKASCISVNEEVVHGIPSGRVLMTGDLVKIDIGVVYDGFYADAARTFVVGVISEEARRLCRVTEDALSRGITSLKVGGRLTDISHAIQTFVENNGFSVVRELGGHGIGAALHEDPLVPNFGPPGTGPVLASGIVLAIEPMVNTGGPEVQTQKNGWTIVTRDGSLSAHFEDTVVATDGGTLNLTNGAN